MIAVILIILTVILDQATKIYIKESMVLGQSISVIGDFFRITFVENPGIAFGIRVGNSLVFTILSIAASIGICIYLITHWKEGRRLQIGLSLILGGAFGNLIDRILYHKVVDFLDVGLKNVRWPVFNIADAAVVIGMFFLFFTVISAEKEARLKSLEADDSISQETLQKTDAD